MINNLGGVRNSPQTSHILRMLEESSKEGKNDGKHKRS